VSKTRSNGRWKPTSVDGEEVAVGEEVESEMNDAAENTVCTLGAPALRSLSKIQN
jgi:hypothetical protein